MRKYLKELVEIHGPSGKEKKVRDYIKEKIEGKIDEIKEDCMGNLIVFKKGNNPQKN